MRLWQLVALAATHRTDSGRPELALAHDGNATMAEPAGAVFAPIRGVQVRMVATGQDRAGSRHRCAIALGRRDRNDGDFLKLQAHIAKAQNVVIQQFGVLDPLFIDKGAVG
jgi:hypothetical protein